MDKNAYIRKMKMPLKISACLYFVLMGSYILLPLLDIPRLFQVLIQLPFIYQFTRLAISINGGLGNFIYDSSRYSPIAGYTFFKLFIMVMVFLIGGFDSFTVWFWLVLVLEIAYHVLSFVEYSLYDVKIVETEEYYVIESRK